MSNSNQPVLSLYDTGHFNTIWEYPGGCVSIDYAKVRNKRKIKFCTYITFFDENLEIKNQSFYTFETCLEMIDKSHELLKKCCTELKPLDACKYLHP